MSDEDQAKVANDSTSTRLDGTHAEPSAGRGVDASIGALGTAAALIGVAVVGLVALPKLRRFLRGPTTIVDSYAEYCRVLSEEERKAEALDPELHRQRKMVNAELAGKAMSDVNAAIGKMNDAIVRNM